MERLYPFNNNDVLTDQMKYMELLQTDTRWTDEFFDKGAIENYSLSARGGNEKTKYSISTNYLRDEGVLLTDYFKKMSLRLSMSTKPNKSDRIWRIDKSFIFKPEEISRWS